MYLIRSRVPHKNPKIDTRYFFEDSSRLPRQGWLFPCFGCGSLTSTHTDIITYSDTEIRRYDIVLRKLTGYEIPYCKQCWRHRPGWMSPRIMFLRSKIEL